MIKTQGLASVLVLASTVAGGLGWRWRQQAQRLQSLRALPTPPGHWPSGNALELIALAKNGRFSQKFLEWTQQYGPLFVVWLFNNPILIVSKPKLIEQILVQGQSDGIFARSPNFYGAYQDVFGVHIGNQKGQEWKWRRQAAAPSFKPNQFSQKLDVIVDSCMGVVDDIQQLASKQEIVCVDSLFVNLTMGVIAHFLLGVSLDGKPNFEGEPPFEPQKLYKALAVLEKQVLLQSAGKSKWLKYLPTKEGRTYKNAQQYIENFLAPRVAMALRLAREPNAQSIAGVSQQFRTLMLIQFAKNPQHNLETLVAEAKAFLFAGHDTTAHTLSFAVGALELTPTVRQKSQAIVDGIWQQEGCLNTSVIKKLTYIEAIVKETMRLYPVAPGIPLVATQDTEINGIQIPQKTGIEPFFLGAGRDPEMYPNPDEFHPERWLQADEAEGMPGKQPLHLGFSLGPHYCLGAPLALLEATIMLAALLHYFDWELVNGSTSLEQFD
ncbi:cytochrome P450 [Nodosilinea sp. FACHB-13]|uniref:cytochrome P450 n=1 Tax=Cyanophyceae TaxID=3028117 RepID=UPI001687F8CB|nr:cytochrome P450 [Nodosilinea sp. FACHB-13]MBD2106729.1 cytochrome P450 [Nodosilinea sp. FACHB-13]